MPERENPSAGPRKPRPKSERTKRRILAAAEKLFAAKGFSATGMRELAREAEVNLATITYFFGSKGGLLETLLEDIFEAYTGFIRNNLVGTEPLEVKIRNLIREGVAYFSANPGRLLILISDMHREDPEISALKARRVSEVMAIFQREVGDVLAAEGRPFPVLVAGPGLLMLIASRFLLAPVQSRARPRDYRDLSPENYADAIADLYLNGLKGLGMNTKRERNSNA
jgi:AcrR family transcriptional regulator